SLRKKQRDFISIFKAIKSADVIETLDIAENLFDDESDNISLVKKSVTLKGSNAKSKMYQYVFIHHLGVAIVACLSVYLAIININRIFDVGQRFSILDQCGTMKTISTRAFCAAREFIDFENNALTWNNDKTYLNSELLNAISYLGVI
ncbi:hypothetical protein HK096_001033, partial [Nowakowskiella sp. JEL0078]